MTDTTGQICLWFQSDAEAAARFYAETFPNGSVGRVHRAPADNPSAKQGDPLTVDFTVMGIRCMGLNGGPHFKQSEAFSFVVVTEDQEETDRYWNAIVGRSEERRVGNERRGGRARAEDGIRDFHVTGVQTCALPICIARPPTILPPNRAIR